MDENRFDSIFGNLRHVLSTGHEMMAYMKMILKLMLDHGYDVLAPAYNFRSPKAIQTLFQGADTHRSIEFILEVARPVLTDELIHQWRRERNQIDCTDNADDFYKWSRERCAIDVHFKSHWNLVIRLLGAFDLVIKGIRNNKKYVYNAGRKFLIPFMGTLGHYTYYKAVLRDMYEYDCACTKEVRDECSQHFSTGSGTNNKQGYDFEMEQTVRRLKTNNTVDTPLGFQIAAIMTNQGSAYRETYYGESGHQMPRTDCQRSKTILVKTLATARKIITDCEIFIPNEKATSTNVVQIAGTKDSYLDEGTDITSLEATGLASLKRSVDTAFVENNPFRVVLTFERKRKEQQRIDKNTTPPDENDNENIDSADIECDNNCDSNEEQEGFLTINDEFENNES